MLLLFAGMIGIAQTISYKSLSLELQAIQKQLVPDKRVAVLKVELKDTLQTTIVVFGETDLPEAKSQLIEFLTNRNVSFIDSLKLLPDASMGDKIWGLATLSVSNMRALPDDATELVSQALMGTPVKILDYRNKFYRVQTPDNYIGWMDASGLQLFTQQEMEQWRASKRFVYKSLTGYAYDAPGKRAAVVSDLALGDIFEVESTSKGFYKIKIPDGRIGFVRKSECISFENWSQSEPDVKTILSVAGKQMGSPYLWGGASGKASDCSGFVKLVFYSQGIILARDASQQARYGEMIDFRKMENLQAGDLLFFGSSAQRIVHVGIYIDKGNFIHASGRVHISSIDPADPKYVAARNTVSARRILNSLNTVGIVRVKNHPWYCTKP
ncbi:MAG: NlpC/P60 family protein [Bacteroidales bacterium]